jgi:hypothetical protein
MRLKTEYVLHKRVRYVNKVGARATLPPMPKVLGGHTIIIVIIIIMDCKIVFEKKIVRAKGFLSVC